MCRHLLRIAGPGSMPMPFSSCAETELDHYRAVAPDLESHVEIREDSTGVMVSAR